MSRPSSNGHTKRRSRSRSPKMTRFSAQPTAQSIVDTTIVSDDKFAERSFLCTHHGSFHCDEALALAMLKVLPRYAKMPIVRTRNPEIIKKALLVVDVGGVKSENDLRFDHHMGDFVETFSQNQTVTKLSSAGLVWKYVGKEILKEMTQNFSEDILSTLWIKLYKSFILEIDAIDNGVEPAKDMKYRVSTGLGSRVKRCNPSWRATNVSAEVENDSFKKAMSICFEEFVAQVNGVVEEWYPARALVEEALLTVTSGKSMFPYKEKMAAKGGYSTSSSEPVSAPRTIYFHTCCPWQEHLMDIEEELGMSREEEKALYVIFPDTRSGSYRIQACPVTRGSFENRKPLPEKWRGVRDEELSKVAGIDGCVFCHASGFIGGNATKEGALEMAKKAG